MAMTAQLPSWNDGAAKQAIIDFVGRVTEDGGPDYVEPAARVAVFDNDGTLWTEKPLVIQLDFTIRRFGEMAKNDPALRTQQPYQAAYEQDLRWMGAAMVKHYNGDDSDLKLLMVAVPKAFESVTIEDYDQRVRAFFDEAVNPHLRRPYRECGYAPMVELLGRHGFLRRRPGKAHPHLEPDRSPSHPGLRQLQRRRAHAGVRRKRALDVAAQQNWTVVSIQNDWNTVFADAT
jgi:hypothetical protein